MSRAIKKLSEVVINRIAAGEVVQRPCNVIKELLENCLDAGSTSITIIVKNGGLQFIQIQDNGKGIHKDDLEILCHRFTTSKLREFEDLQSIATFGFRGEALASISHVARLTLVTKVKDSVVAYKAEYNDGVLRDAPTPCAGNQGTVITVEDLFYNMAIRRNAMKSTSEEHSKIVDIVTKYALHNAGVGFLLKRQNESSAEVRTTVNSTIDQAISSLYGSTVAKDMISFEIKHLALGFSAEGLMSHPSYQGKKFLMILFINDRLVDCSRLKKGLENLYSQILSKKCHPLLYLNVKIKPENLDVNVHPTKAEVHFLFENEIIEQIQNAVEAKVLGCNESRTFFVKTLQPSSEIPLDISKTENIQNKRKINESEASTSKSTIPKVYDHQMIRTDCKERKLEEFFSPLNFENEETIRIDFGFNNNKNNGSECETAPAGLACCNAGTVDISEDDRDMLDQSRDVDVCSLYAEDYKRPKWRHIKLTSMSELQKEIETSCSRFLRNLIKGHSYVGTIDPKFALIQHQTTLYLVNTTRLSEELFYQMLAFRFGNFGVFRLDEPCPLYDAIFLALGLQENSWDSEKDNPKEELAKIASDLLDSKSELLWDYFSIEIKDGRLISLPNVLDGYVPQMEGLPTYLLRLASEVQWDAEKSCFDTLCRETAKFYSLKKQYCNDLNSTAAGSINYKWKWLVESLLYPTFKAKLMPPAIFTQNETIIRLTTITDLFKVFERC